MQLIFNASSFNLDANFLVIMLRNRTETISLAAGILYAFFNIENCIYFILEKCN